MSKKIRRAGTLDSETSNKVAKVEANIIQKTSDELNEEQQKLLAECESDIQKNLRGTFVVGWRLEQIRDERLYRGEGYTTFEAYCKKRWDFSKTHANRNIQAYLCEKHLKELKSPKVYIPTKESQVRFIADLKPEQWVEVATKVKEGVGEGEATAGDFGTARRELFPKLKREAKVMEPAKEAAQPAKPNEAAPRFDTNLVSMTQIIETLKQVSYIYNNSGKKQEGLKLIDKVERWLGDWAEWEAEQKEAA
jgi:hypothetical protein